MAKKTGLGKGLDALFSQPEIINNMANEVKENDIVQTLKLIDIEPNREQPRKYFDEDALEELANSIKSYGLIQPIVVTKKEDYYQIIAGERRWRACKKVGLTEVPVIVRDDDIKKNQEIALIENLQREDLNAYEKAVGIRNLMDTYSLTQQEVADTLGKRRSSIANTVRILNLDPRVLEFAKDGKLTEGHCKALLAITEPNKQYNTALRMIETGASVRETEKKTRLTKKNPDVDRKYQAIFRDIEDSFQGFFGTKVKLDAGKRKGKIIIEYNNNDDLERILGLIK